MVILKSNTIFNLIIAAVCMLAMILDNKVSKRRMMLGIVYILFFSVSLFISVMLYGRSGSGFEFNNSMRYSEPIHLASRAFTMSIIGMSFSMTTNYIDFSLSLMQQLKLPIKFGYGVLAALNFIPVIRHEFIMVGLSLKSRGVRYYFLPIKSATVTLIHVFEHSEKIAMAMESRGFSSGKRHFYRRLHLGICDYVFIVLVVIIVTVMLIVL
jgi:energy-coupling factor transport system permease protein